MSTNLLWKCPAPSSSFLDGVHLTVGPNRMCSITFDLEAGLGKMVKYKLHFNDIAAFKCTYLQALTVEMIESAYDRVIDVGESEWLREVRTMTNSNNAKHLRICFDDGPCYEFICSEFEVAPPPSIDN